MSSSPPPSGTPSTPAAPPPSESPPSPPPNGSSAPPPSSPPPPDSSPPPKDSSPPPPSPDSSPPPSPTDKGSDQSPPSPPPPVSSSSSSPPPPPPPKDNNSSSSPSPTSSQVPSPPSNSTSRAPPSRSLAPPPPRSPSQQGSPSPGSSSSNHNSSSLSEQKLVIIVGVAAGVALLFCLMTLIFLICGRKKRKSPPDHKKYYGGPPPQSKGGEYYYANQPPQQGNNWRTPPPEHVIKFQSPAPGGAAGTPHSMGWSMPPPPGTSSGEMSSNYSGGFQAQGQSKLPPHPCLSLGFSQNSFTYEDLATATMDFSQEHILGQGGFGYVFKGILPGGKEVAVKCLKAGSGQGDREFQAEVEIITRVHHRHLVTLVGYCIAGPQRMLVYEFVPNNTLEYHLHGKDRMTMDWPTRLKIALGSAKGLAYLHEDCHPRIIHRNIKAANILLENNFEAKVADFGLAKLTSDNFTHVSTRVMGTFGYLAPEYAASGKLTEKSDTFSFGVMLLELITGRRPVDPTGEFMEDSLVDWARPLIDSALGSGIYNELVDPGLGGNYAPNELASMVACAGACTRHSAKRRPKMSQVVRALEGDVSLDDLNVWNKKTQNTLFGESGSSTEEETSYSADMKKFRRVAFGTSQDYMSSEYGGNTSEYGLNPSSTSSDSREMSHLGSPKSHQHG